MKAQQIKEVLAEKVEDPVGEVGRYLLCWISHVTNEKNSEGGERGGGEGETGTKILLIFLRIGREEWTFARVHSMFLSSQQLFSALIPMLCDELCGARSWH